ncbi:MAG: hypothetical protein QF475_00785 [Candidatus Undinarchaeales archaeon]|nr:hypothetical protein [Candidatus Undinarchaeales archaeon]
MNRKGLTEDSKKIMGRLGEYLQENPFAVTIFEVVKAEKNGFLKEYRAKSKGPEEKKDLQTGGKLWNLIYKREDTEKMISKVQMIDAGEAYFRLYPGNMKSKVKQLFITVPGKDRHKKIAVRMMLEYVDIFLKRRIYDAKMSLKILQVLANAEKQLTAKEIAEKIYKNIEGENKEVDGQKQIGRTFKMTNMLEKIKTRPRLVKTVKGIKKKGQRGRIANGFVLEKFFKEAWEIATNEDTIELWDDWKKKGIRAGIQWRAKRK